jgi:hypothetical protein
MSQEKYIGMDVHQATISVAVMDAGGKLIMECEDQILFEVGSPQPRTKKSTLTRSAVPRQS